MINAFAVVFANIHDAYLPVLTENRTFGSVPICGRYRIIDFTLSNLSNSGIYKVGVITRNNYHSLIDHVGSGKEWDLSRKLGGLMIYPPFSTSGSGQLYRDRLEALRNIRDVIARQKEEYVVLADSNTMMNLDLQEVLSYHENQNADVTCVYRKTSLKGLPAGDTTLYDVGEDGRVTGVYSDLPVLPEKGNDSLCVWVFRTSHLLRMIDDSGTGRDSFEKNVLAANVDNWRIMGYEMTHYAARISNAASYYKTAMDFLNPAVRADLFPAGRPIYTKVHDEAPAFYAEGSEAVNSMIANGCRIEGAVENSILGRGVYIEKGAVVRNSLLMQGVVVSSGAKLDCCIIDKNTYISPDRCLSGAPIYPFVAKKMSTI